MAVKPTHDHICVTQAVCFQCFKAGMEKVRARQDAWAQRSLPFDEAPAPASALTSRAVAHRQQMLAHLAQAVRSGRR